MQCQHQKGRPFSVPFSQDLSFSEHFQLPEVFRQMVGALAEEELIVILYWANNLKRKDI